MMSLEVDEIWALTRLKTLKKIQRDLSELSELLRDEIAMLEKLGDAKKE